MSLLVTGSIGIDTVETPHGRAEEVLGGSAVYFALAARMFAGVRLVGVVGEDFPPEFRRKLEHEAIDLAGLETRPGARTFRWTGRYEGDMNEAHTVDVRLNVLEDHPPRVPEAYRDSDFVFLANTHPALQRELLAQVDSPRLAVCDTMNIWIANERAELEQTLQRVHGLVMNEGEARMLTGLTNLVEAGHAALAMGPRFVIIKKGEHGALIFTAEGVAALPAFPCARTVDPTGAGDSFAGGMMGYLASRGDVSPAALKRAVAHGIVTASFVVEDFSTRRLEQISRREFNERFKAYQEMLTLP